MVEEKNLNDAMSNFAQAPSSDRSDFTQLTDINAYLQQHVAHVSSNNDELQQNSFGATKPDEHDESC